MKKIFVFLSILFFFCLGCEETNLQMATEAGVETVKALTLSDEQVLKLSAKAAANLDAKHRVAPADNPYAQRLRGLVAKHQKRDGQAFEYKVYLSPKVNAFALGNGNIRVYSGLMDLLSDEEMLFVIGHEMGHVIKDHVQEKMRLALAASALRKGVASQQNIVGDLARSTLGAFGQRLLNAQFSQHEEMEADDYGLRFMLEAGYNPEKAVSALKKLASKGNNHYFLSSHPAPQKRVEHLQNADKIEKEKSRGLIKRIWSLLVSGVQALIDLLGRFFSLF